MYDLKVLELWQLNILVIEPLSVKIMPNDLAFMKSETHGPQWLTWVNSYKSLIQHFSLSMATNQIE